MLKSCKNKIAVRFLCLLLALLMLLPMVASCKKGEEEANGTVTTENAPSETESPYRYDENGYIMDNIPDDINYGSREVKILCWIDDASVTSLPSEGSEDEVSNELYRRRLRVEERLGVVLSVKNEPGGHANMGTFVTLVENSNNAGTPYDLVNSYSSTCSTMVQKDLLQNLNGLSFPQTEMPWYPASVKDYEQNGNLFYIASNSSLQSLTAMMLMFCDSKKFTDAKMTDPVELVANNEWTMEKMLEYVSNFAIYDKDNDDSFYGLAVEDSTRMDAFYYGCGFHNTIQSDGRAEIAYTSETAVDRVITLIDKMVPVFNSGRVEIAPNTPMLMIEGKTALMVASLYQIKRLPTFDYAPIPMPKLDNEQENYITVQNAGFDIWTIPKVVTEPEISGVIIEAFSSDDYRNIAPIYFEKNTKLRYSTSVEVMQMFDIIRNSLVYDFGRVNQVVLNYRCESLFRKCFVQETSTGSNVWKLYAQNNYASRLEERRETIHTELETLLEDYK